MDHVHALIERGGPQGCLLIGLYVDRAHAIDVATSHAQHRLQRCSDVDRLAFGRSSTALEYELTKLDAGVTFQVGLIYRPANEADTMAWIVDTRDIIPAPPLVQPELGSLFADIGEAT